MFDFSPHAFGPYQLLDKIGQGGMAEIFRAESRGSQGFVKEVAIKRILSSLASNEDFVTQFLDEARIAGSLSHPNIVQILDVGQVEDSYYIAMEFVNGRHLGQVIRTTINSGQYFPLHVAVLIIKEVAQALAFAHSARDPNGQPMQIIHRDISPQNILVDYHGAIKLTDFGIAKAANKLFQTTAGVIKGKFSYLAPEQLIGHAASSASDLFSLGVVFWEMLSGRRLFQGESDIKTIQLVQACEVPSVNQFRGDIPDTLDEIVCNLLASSPQHRYQDASLLVRDLSYFMTNNAIPDSPSQVAHYMGSLFPDAVPSTVQPATKASLPAISAQDAELYQSASSFEDEDTPVASTTELDSSNAPAPSWEAEPVKAPAWDDGAPTQVHASDAPITPGPAGAFDDVHTAAVDMSPLLAPQAFQGEGADLLSPPKETFPTGGSQGEEPPSPPPTVPLDEDIIKKVQKAARAGNYEETADLSAMEEIGDTVQPVQAPTKDLNSMEGLLASPDDVSTPDAETIPLPPPAPRSGSSSFFVVIVVVLLCALGGMGATAYVLLRKPKPRVISKPPERSTVTLQVEIDPPGAKVMLNGQPMDGKAKKRTISGLHGGFRYQIQASMKGYKPQRKFVELKGKITRIDIKLEKQP